MTSQLADSFRISFLSEYQELSVRKRCRVWFDIWGTIIKADVWDVANINHDLDPALEKCNKFLRGGKGAITQDPTVIFMRSQSGTLIKHYVVRVMLFIHITFMNLLLTTVCIKFVKRIIDRGINYFEPWSQTCRFLHSTYLPWRITQKGCPIPWHQQVINFNTSLFSH